MNRLILAPVMSLLIAPGLPAGERKAKSIQCISYEDFMKLSHEGRVEIFNLFTPEKRAEITKTHLTRWREANRARLSDAQIEWIDQTAALIDADLYRGSKEERAARLRDVELTGQTLFAPEDLAAMTRMAAFAVPQEPRQ